MANKLDMGEITSFDKVKLKKTETPEKNTLQTKETTEEEKQSESSSFIHDFINLGPFSFLFDKSG
uniref:Thymosin beta-10 n=2 Tax=Ailuropoda melanoleuca TaxID=9646 RepID=A0A7N5JFG4_AILME